MFPRGRRTPTPAMRVVSTDPLWRDVVADPDPADLVWMEELREFLRGPGVDLGDLEYLQARYLDYCTNWHAQAPEQRWNPRTVLNAFGVALGDLVRGAAPGLSWKLTVHLNPATLVLATEADQIVASPLKDIENRWLARDLNWMRSYPALVTRAVPQAEASPARAPRRPIVLPPFQGRASVLQSRF